MTAEEDKRWKVGELAAATGLTVRALHHYDDVGLLVPSQRTAGGHRVYDARDAQRLYRILALRRLGFRLDEIAALLDDGGVSLLETVRRHLEQVERELEHQHRLRERLSQILEALQQSTQPPVDDYLDAVEAMTVIEIDVQDVIMRVPADEADSPAPRSAREGFARCGSRSATVGERFRSGSALRRATRSSTRAASEKFPGHSVRT